MTETESLSYSMLCLLYDEVKDLEESAMNDFFKRGGTDYKETSATLRRTTTIKYLIEDKLYTIWKEITKND